MGGQVEEVVVVTITRHHHFLVLPHSRHAYDAQESLCDHKRIGRCHRV
jgi:hypothetical protein